LYYFLTGHGIPRPYYETEASREQFAAGSEEWLVLTELKYGGLVSDVRVKRVSEQDPRTRSQDFTVRMTGGDRMSVIWNGYGRKYAKYLKPFVARAETESITLVEVGILRGTGLAIWSDLFGNGRIVGLDIDVSHFRENLGRLKGLGAFTHDNVTTHEFDQYRDNAELLRQLLGGRKIDVMIDDGKHDDEPILTTFRSVLPHLANPFVYFIEDNSTVWRALRATYPSYRYDVGNGLVVVRS
jgi:hypothetical protein